MFQTDLYTDLEWLNNISYRFDRFKRQTGRNVFACRCPYCGDSKKSKRKTRFYIYEKKGGLFYDCKNCSESGTFYGLMKDQFPDMFEEYKREQTKARIMAGHRPNHKRSKPKPEPTLELDDKTESRALQFVVPINSLPNDHVAKKYLIERGFDDDQLKRLMFAEDFKRAANSISHAPLDEKFPSEPRIVIPFYDKEGNITVIQGRSLNPKSKMKYITIKTHPDVSKVYGLESVDASKTVYCVEGPLDSLFVENCVATCDPNLTAAKADVYIWDNQPRNKEIIALMENAIEQGKKVVIFPYSPMGKLDINDLILMGMTKQQIMEVIRQHTFRGIKAKLELSRWRRI